MRAVHTFRISTRLPPALEPLRDIAVNFASMGDARVQDTFRRVDPDLWEADGLDGMKLLGAVSQDRLDALAGDAGFVAAIEALRDDLRRDLAAPHWFQLQHEGELDLVAYFSLEYGVAEALPIYSGGLGILAGDHLKAASDLGVPLVALGLFYHYGYLQQTLDRTGWQRERFRQLNPRDMALQPVRDADVVVDLAGVPVRARVWRAEVGGVHLYLLDADIDDNDDAGRAVTDRLYGGDAEHRLRQEILLGVGGLRLLESLGLHAQVFHMNEGHAAFLALERIRRAISDDGLSFDEAVEATRPAQLFTTHTPVPAGIDRFPRELIEKYFTAWADECGVDIDTLMDLGHEPGAEPGTELNLAAMGLRLAGAANGVSKIHGEVSRRMFNGVFPELGGDEAPIGSVTNGVHGRTWVSREMADFLDRQIGPDWPEAEPEQWARLETASDEELWAIRRIGRERLVGYARHKVRASLLARGLSESETAWCDDILDPATLTIVFARRFAPYKRATLLLNDLDRLKTLVLSKKRPVQVVFAGKAHPADDEGKQFLRAVAELATDVEWRDHVVFLDDYGMGVARMLVRGADLWLNTPRRLMEACGTSGMKATLNGGLNCSILDGWWDEMFDGEVGWAVPSAEWIDDPGRRDATEAASLLTILESQVVPAFYDRADAGLPAEWLRRMKASLAHLGPQVSATRMVRDYVDDWYLPATRRARTLAADGFAGARELVGWRHRIAEVWPAVAIVGIIHEEQFTAGSTQRVWADLTLGGLAPDEVEVQLWHGQVDADDELRDPVCTPMVPEGNGGSDDGRARYVATIECSERGSYGFTVRAVPSHPHLREDGRLPFARHAPPKVTCLE